MTKLDYEPRRPGKPSFTPVVRIAARVAYCVWGALTGAVLAIMAQPEWAGAAHGPHPLCIQAGAFVMLVVAPYTLVVLVTRDSRGALIDLAVCTAAAVGITFVVCYFGLTPLS